MEKEFHRYNLEGLELKIPLRKRKGRTDYSENLNDLFDNPKVTPLGHRVIVSWDWVCEHFKKLPSCEAKDPKSCECSDCEYFARAESETGFETQIGICTHEFKTQIFNK